MSVTLNDPFCFAGSEYLCAFEIFYSVLFNKLTDLLGILGLFIFTACKQEVSINGRC